MDKIAIAVIFFVVFFLSLYFGINAWQRWAGKMKAREDLRRVTAHDLERIVTGMQLTSEEKRAAAKDILAEGKGQRKPPGMLALWLYNQLGRY